MKDIPESSRERTEKGDPGRVIVVDDDENLLKVVSLELHSKGYVCETALDGVIALELLGKTDYDVALVDLVMPVMDGFQVLDAIQRDHPDTIPIVVTGSCDIPRALKAMKLGAFDFLEKPCNPKLIESTIQRAIAYRHTRQHALKMELEADEARLSLKMERANSQAQKLESVGRLAAGIAHEINTPAQYVGDNIEFLQVAHESIAGLLEIFGRIRNAAATGSVPPQLLSEANELVVNANLEYLLIQIPRAIEQSIEGVERISSIVQAMKEFSHPGTAEKTFTDLNQCIRSTVIVSRNEWKYVADLETDLDGALPPVCCLPGELNQVFLNLIVNAAHAIGDVVGDGADAKGKIVVSTGRDGDSVEIRISDTGTGIPEEIRDQVFDPFFTTKAVGRGTGQGLAIARNVVVDKHGGTITFDSEAGKGTAFTIRIPVSEKS